MTKITFVQPGKQTADLDVNLAKTDDLALVTADGAGFYNSLKAGDFDADVTLNTGALNPAVAAAFADGLVRGSYTFDKYKTTPQEQGPQHITVTTSSPKQAAAAFKELQSTTESVFWASDLVNEPGNILNPETYEARVKAELEPLGIKVRVIQADEMAKLNMGAALAVGAGSKTPPRMIVLEYDGTQGAEKRPLALVGKGITFDTGGINLKPAHGIAGMSMDMAGSAAVAGAIRALAARGAKANVVGVMAIAENAIGSNATLPDSIVPTMSGKTVSIDNTDAEGRLVLCDALTYVQKTYNPHTVVDLATLTGAVIMALGTDTAGAFTNSDELMDQFNTAAASANEALWRMPLEDPAFKEAVENSAHADLTNDPAGPGASVAAAYLYEFVDKNRPYMHIDMAGPGTHSTGERRGWGVRLLHDLVSQFYEIRQTANENVPVTAAAARKQALRLNN